MCPLGNIHIHDEGRKRGSNYEAQNLRQTVEREEMGLK